MISSLPPHNNTAIILGGYGLVACPCSPDPDHLPDQCDIPCRACNDDDRDWAPNYIGVYCWQPWNIHRPPQCDHICCWCLRAVPFHPASRCPLLHEHLQQYTSHPAGTLPPPPPCLICRITSDHWPQNCPIIRFLDPPCFNRAISGDIHPRNLNLMLQVYLESEDYTRCCCCKAEIPVVQDNFSARGTNNRWRKYNEIMNLAGPEYLRPPRGYDYYRHYVPLIKTSSDNIDGVGKRNWCPVTCKEGHSIPQRDLGIVAWILDQVSIEVRDLAQNTTRDEKLLTKLLESMGSKDWKLYCRRCRGEPNRRLGLQKGFQQREKPGFEHSSSNLEREAVVSLLAEKESGHKKTSDGESEMVSSE